MINHFLTPLPSPSEAAAPLHEHEAYFNLVVL